jgi:hypothetical protein
MAPYTTGRRSSGFDHGQWSEKRRLHAKASDTRSGFEFVSGLSDFAAGAAMLIFMLAPFSLPVLALTALAAVALLIPAVVGAVLAAPFLLARRQWRSRDRLSGDTKPSGRGGGGEARMRRRRSFGALGRPVVPYPVGLHRLNSEAFRGSGEVR